MLQVADGEDVCIVVTAPVVAGAIVEVNFHFGGRVVTRRIKVAVDGNVATGVVIKVVGNGVLEPIKGGVVIGGFVVAVDDGATFVDDVVVVATFVIGVLGFIVVDVVVVGIVFVVSVVVVDVDVDVDVEVVRIDVVVVDVDVDVEVVGIVVVVVVDVDVDVFGCDVVSKVVVIDNEVVVQLQFLPFGSQTQLDVDDDDDDDGCGGRLVPFGGAGGAGGGGNVVVPGFIAAS